MFDPPVFDPADDDDRHMVTMECPQCHFIFDAMACDVEDKEECPKCDTIMEEVDDAFTNWAEKKAEEMNDER